MKRPLRILQFINSLAMGGAEKRLAEIVAGLSGGEFEFHVVCLSETGHYEEAIRATGAPIRVLRYRRIREGGRLRPMRTLEPLRMMGKLRAAATDIAPEVVHTWIPVCNVIGGLALGGRRFCALPLIASRVFTGEYREGNRLLQMAEDRAARRADVVYCNSESVREDVRRREASIPSSKIRVIPNGVDMDRFAPSPNRRGELRSSLGIAPGEIAALVAGALRPHKGHADLLRAAAVALRERGEIVFLLAGPDQGEGAELNRLAQELGIAPRARFLGARDDMPDLMRACDMLVLPSLQEGLPNVLLEAQSTALPCVATELPGCVEALEDGKTGLITPARDPESLARTILALAADAERRRRMGEAGRERVRGRFSMHAMLEGFAAMYRDVAGRERM